MTLPDHLNVTVSRIINLYTSTQDGSGAQLDALIDGLGYNDTGLICAYFRGRGDTYVAEYIEQRRLR